MLEWWIPSNALVSLKRNLRSVSELYLAQTILCSRNTFKTLLICNKFLTLLQTFNSAQQSERTDWCLTVRMVYVKAMTDQTGPSTPTASPSCSDFIRHSGMFHFNNIDTHPHTHSAALNYFFWQILLSKKEPENDQMCSLSLLSDQM